MTNFFVAFATTTTIKKKGEDEINFHPFSY